MPCVKKREKEFFDWELISVQRHGENGNVPPGLPQRGGEATDSLWQPLSVPGMDAEENFFPGEEAEHI